MRNPTQSRNRPSRPSPPDTGVLVGGRNLSVSLYELPRDQARVEGSFLSADHLISLRLIVDLRRARIARAEGGLEAFPCRRCPRAARRIRRLRGVAVGLGSVEEVSRRLGGPSGCVHLRELGRALMVAAAEALIGHREGFGLMGSRHGDLFEEVRRELVEKHWKGQCVAYPVGEGDVCRECLECSHPCGRGQRRRATATLTRPSRR